MNNIELKPAIRNVQLVSVDHPFYKLYLSQFRRKSNGINNSAVKSKSFLISMVLERTVQEWIKTSATVSKERIIYYEIGRKRFFKELDYVIKKNNRYIIGEIKVSSMEGDVVSKAAKQLNESKIILSHISKDIGMQIISINLNYKNTEDKLDEFNPNFSGTIFRSVELNRNKYEFINLSPVEINQWGVNNSIVKTPELLQAAIFEAELRDKRRSAKKELEDKVKIQVENKVANDSELQTEIKDLMMLVSILTIKIDLLEKGWVHLTNKSEEFLNEVLQNLGEVIFVTDVIIKEDSKALITSGRALDYHTDHHKAKFIAWYCRKQTSLGGETILMDAEKVYGKLKEDEKKELEHIELFEHKIFPDDKESHPLVNNDYPRKFYYSYWLVKKEQNNNSALKEFQRIIKEAEPLKILLASGDILIIDNHRIFHGRTSIDGSKDRFLRRYWVSNS